MNAPGASNTSSASGTSNASSESDAQGVPAEPDSPDGSVRMTLSGVGLVLGGQVLLSGVDLVLDGGAPVALTGPSGSGKTVLCLVLAGAMPATRGEIRIERTSGAVVVDGTSARSGVTGLVMQTHGLVEGLTAEENVALPLQARALGRDEVARRTDLALGDVGLRRHASRPVDELSGGERQRVGIARGIAADPAVLVADEPTAELDPDNRARVLGLLTTRARRGRLVIVASDDPEVVGACGRVVVLDRGTIVSAAADVVTR